MSNDFSPEVNSLINGQTSFSQHKYITHLYECEKKKYVLNERIKSIKEQIQPLMNETYPEFEKTSFYSEYEKNYKEIPDIKEVEPPDPLWDGGAFLIIIVFCVIGVLIGGLGVGTFSCIVSCSSAESYFSSYFTPWAIAGFCIALVLSIFLLYWGHSGEVTAYQEYTENLSAMTEERKALQVSNENNYNMYKTQYDNWLKNANIATASKIEVLQNELSAAESTLNQVTSALSELYNLKIDGNLFYHDKFHGLNTVAIIYELFDMKICTQFEGPYGAYNLCKEEKYRTRVLEELGALNVAMKECDERLVELQRASNEVLSAIEDTNDNIVSMQKNVNSIGSTVSKGLSSLSNQLDSINENTANGAYYAKIGSEISAINAIYNGFNY